MLISFNHKTLSFRFNPPALIIDIVPSSLLSRIHNPLFENKKALGLLVDSRYASVSFNSNKRADIGFITVTQNAPIAKTASNTGTKTPQIETPAARIITNSFVLLIFQNIIIEETITTKGITLSTVSGSLAITYSTKKPTETSALPEVRRKISIISNSIITAEIINST